MALESKGTAKGTALSSILNMFCHSESDTVFCSGRKLAFSFYVITNSSFCAGMMWIIVCHFNNTGFAGSDAAVECCSLSFHICFNFKSFLNSCCVSKLHPGKADSTFAIQKHIEPKYLSHRNARTVFPLICISHQIHLLLYSAGSFAIN